MLHQDSLLAVVVAAAAAAAVALKVDPALALCLADQMFQSHHHHLMLVYQMLKIELAIEIYRSIFFNEHLLEPKPPKAAADVAGAPNDGVLNENDGAADVAPKPPNDAPKLPNACCAEKKVKTIP